MTIQKSFREVQLPKQKTQDNAFLFPAVLFPTDPTRVQLSDFKDSIKAHKLWLESLLHTSGAILFRGFQVRSPSDFNGVVEAFGFPELLYVGGAAPRTKVVDRVYTTNESPLDKEIPFHHEMAYVPDPPTKLFFFCEEEPIKGGETPIVSSFIVYEKMKERHPDFVAKLEEHGLIYIKIAGYDDDPSSSNGSGWKSTYKTHDKSIAEERAAEVGMKLEWMENNTVKIETNPLRAIGFDEESHRKTWFNSLGIGYSGPGSKKIEVGNTWEELGNGDPVDEDAVKDIMKIMEEECVAIPWKKYDVLLVNNLTVLHGRRPLIKAPRRILTSLCK